MGIAPGAKIIPIRFLGQSGGTLAGAIDAIEYVKSTPAKIINASWGGNGCSQILSDKIASLNEHGILFVVAAGNSGSNLDRFPEYPAAFKHAHQITVGSVSPLGGMSNFSNYSLSLVHIFAPGFEIMSALPNNKTGSASGTSMATPFVAGALALFKSQNPSRTNLELKDELLKSIVRRSDYQNITRGRLQF
jgi:subtilisin family serine protease